MAYGCGFKVWLYHGDIIITQISSWLYNLALWHHCIVCHMFLDKQTKSLRHWCTVDINTAFHSSYWPPLQKVNSCNNIWKCQCPFSHFDGQLVPVQSPGLCSQLPQRSNKGLLLEYIGSTQPYSYWGMWLCEFIDAKNTVKILQECITLRPMIDDSLKPLTCQIVQLKFTVKV